LDIIFYYKLKFLLMNELNETDQEGLAGMPAGEMTEEDSASVVMPEPDEVSSTNIMGEETATEMPTGELARA
jgi:hypothetical protein